MIQCHKSAEREKGAVMVSGANSKLEILLILQADHSGVATPQDTRSHCLTMICYNATYLCAKKTLGAFPIVVTF